METFSGLLTICAGNSPVTGEFPSQSQWREALIFSLICTWTNGWVDNRDAGDLRRRRAHYDVNVMYKTFCVTCLQVTAQIMQNQQLLFAKLYVVKDTTELEKEGKMCVK